MPPSASLPPHPPVVDTHAHVFERDLPVVQNALHQPDYDFRVSDYVGMLDAHGVSFGVIAAPGFLGTYNDYMLESIAAVPRLRGTAIVDPRSGREELRAMDRSGIVGIRLAWKGDRTLPDLDGTDYRFLLRRVRDLGWHVHVHVEGPRLAPLLPALAASGADLVIDHFGRPDPAKGPACDGFQAMLRTLQNGRTWVKLAAPYRLGCDADQLASILLAEVGAERLLWGSDCPWIDFEREIDFGLTVAWRDRWVPDPRDRLRIDRNALELYRFL